MLLIVQDKIISAEVVQAQFMCNLEACKGACCWEGQYGAPLEAEELPILREIYPKVRPFLRPEGIAAIEAEGPYTYAPDIDTYVTTLVDNGPCAFMTLDAQGVAQCGIEQAHKAGAVDFKKPISCHLYPIRITANKASDFEALNYDEWDICAAACSKGAAHKMPVYRFVKEALVRKYGSDFYEELDAAAQEAFFDED